MDSDDAYGTIAHQCVARAVYPECCCEVTRRGIVNRLWEQERAGRVRTLLDDLIVKAACVDHSAVTHCENQYGPFRVILRHTSVGQCRLCCSDCEVTDRTGTPQPG